MLQNAYLVAKIGADTAENEQHFAKILRKTANYPTGRREAGADNNEGPVLLLVTCGRTPVDARTSSRELLLRLLGVVSCYEGDSPCESDIRRRSFKG